jgi:signal transduction histidine kinase
VSIVLFLCAVTLLILGLIGGHLLANRNDELDRAEKSAANLASAFEEHLAISIGLLDDTLLAARSQDYIRDSDKLRERLKVRPGLNDIALQVAVADRNGQIIASNFDLQGPVSIADRDHFRHFQNGSDDDLFISQPVLGRVSRQWTIQFVRRRIGPDGQFDGVIVISLTPDYLIRFYHSIDVGPSGQVTFAGLDGVVRAQINHGESSFGKTLSDSQLLRAATKSEIGSIRSSDGVRRLVAFKRVRGYPLFVAVGLAEDDVLVDSRREIFLWMAIAMAGIMFLGVVGTLTLRKIRSQRAFEDQIANHQRELEQLVVQRTARLSDEIDKRTHSEQALRESIAALKEAQRSALQASRMASVGQLAAGIAHEINTPAQYVGDNLQFIGQNISSLLETIETEQRLARDDPQANAPIGEAMSMAKIDFLRGELPKAISESLEGIAQIAHIVTSMKDFSHPGTNAKVMADINQSLENTLIVSRNLWKHVAQIERRFDVSLPPVLCYPAEMNQVFLNLIVNAVHAIETSGKQIPGRIVIETSHRGDSAIIRVSDNGTGIPEAIRDRIFDLFFTTKEVGQGTGQGLAICHSVVVGKHHGTIEIDSEEGEGATFTIKLPIIGHEQNEDDLACP